MGGDAEQGLCKLTDRRNQKVLDILTCQNDRGFLFTHTLGGITDIFDCRHIGEEQIQLVDGGGGVANAQELVGHIREDVEKHRILQSLVGIHQALDSEDQECIVGDVAVAVKIHRFRSYAHTVDAEAYLLERLLGVEVSALLVVGHEFFLAELIKVLHDGIVGGPQFAVVSAVGDAESGVEL